MHEKIETCYLCGKSLVDAKVNEVNKDHVPPKQLYAMGMRKRLNPNLYWLPTHRVCNKAFQHDEDYFVHSLGPLAKGTLAGNDLLDDIARKLSKPEGQIIGKMILQEFDKTPSGLILPLGIVVKRFNGKRIQRIIWKITRGLFYKEEKRILDEKTPWYCNLCSPGYEPPYEFRPIVGNPSKGDYPEVFDYKFGSFWDNDNKFFIWSMLFWNKIISIVFCHDPECTCKICQNKKV